MPDEFATFSAPDQLDENRQNERENEYRDNERNLPPHLAPKLRSTVAAFCLGFGAHFSTGLADPAGHRPVAPATFADAAGDRSFAEGTRRAHSERGRRLRGNRLADRHGIRPVGWAKRAVELGFERLLGILDRDVREKAARRG